MALRLPLMKSSSKKGVKGVVPKGHVAVYVGNERRRYIVPLSCLSQPAFKDLLSKAEEEFGFNHPMGGLTIPCDEQTFIHVLQC